MEKRTAAISTKNLKVGYKIKNGRYNVVHENLNLNLMQGEVTCLLGLNGEGKSTLLRSLCEFQPALGGEILLMGRDIGSYSSHEVALTIGVVLTEKTAAGGISVYELVSLGRHPHTKFFGRLKAEDHKIIENSLKSAGVWHKAGFKVSELSDGERQKVMIAKALAQECPVIILDEPTAFLDVTSRIETMSLLRDLAIKQNKTILLSTHDLDIAIQMADRLWLLSKEYGFASGAPEDLILNGTMTKFFSKDGIGFDSATGKFASELPQRSICVGGEPETVFWVGNALLRNGMRAVAYEENCTGIYCKSHDEIKLSISLEGGDFDTRNFNSVENLIHYIQRHPFSLN